MGGWRDPPERRGGYQPPGEIWAAERRPRRILLPQGACSAGCTPMSSSQSPLSSVSACGENCVRSLAPQGHFRAHSVGLDAPPLPTARGAAGAPYWPCPKRKRAAPARGHRIRKAAKPSTAAQCTVQKKRPLGRAPVQWPSGDGGRRIGASADLAWPSGTLGSSAVPVVADPRRIVRTASGWSSHCRSFSFRCRWPGG